MKLNGVIREVSALSDREIARMFAIMATHYDNVVAEKFFDDLAEKDGVLVLCDDNNTIQGFTTFRLMTHTSGKSTIRAIYSGDTIINKSCWGQMELFRGFGGLFKTLLTEKQEPLFWFLLTKGIRTYLLLPLFFKQFYPTVRAETPLPDQELMTQLATGKFGEFYHRETGIVRVLPRADRLNEDLAHIPRHKRRNPHVRFFVDANPGYTEGDELVCLTRISASNLTRVAKQFVKL